MVRLNAGQYNATRTEAAMGKFSRKIIVVMYLLMFAVNLFYVVADSDDLLSFRLPVPFEREKQINIVDGKFESVLESSYKEPRSDNPSEFHKLMYAVEDVLDEYNADYGCTVLTSCSSNVYHKTSQRTLVPTTRFASYPFRDWNRISKDPRYYEITRSVAVELANATMVRKGDAVVPYLGSSTYLKEKYVKYMTGMDPTDYLVYVPDTLSYSSIPGQKSTYFINTGVDVKGAKIVKVVSFDHALKGADIVYFDVKTKDGLSMLFFSIPGENIEGTVIYECDNYITRQMLTLNLKLTILTGGKVPVLKGIYLTVHILFIAFVQNTVLSFMFILANLIRIRKRYRHK